MTLKYFLFLMIIPSMVLLSGLGIKSEQEEFKGKYPYKLFERASKCRTCHPGIYEQWSQAMMSQAYTHHWDEIEYFDLAEAHRLEQARNLGAPPARTAHHHNLIGGV